MNSHCVKDLATWDITSLDTSLLSSIYDTHKEQVRCSSHTNRHCQWLWWLTCHYVRVPAYQWIITI